jgi:hypothetical protein
MRVPAQISLFCAATLFLTPGVSLADEIRLKDGKKLNGVIVAYEDNMFRVKTDFGFVLVERDKIASIIPTTPATSTPAPAASRPARTSGESTSEPDSASAKRKIPTDPVKPALPAAAAAAKVIPPAFKNAPAPGAAIASAQSPAEPAQPAPPPVKEEVQGTLYTNFSHGFRMYKAPSWDLIEDARQALPNAIVAMGTSNESTLMVVGQEPAKDTLDTSANGVEKKLREIYANYRLLSRRKTVVGGAAAIEFKYTGTAEEHEWSGTLVVVARGKDVLTILGMTYADNDLIQIQENVISRAIASTDFNVR